MAVYNPAPGIERFRILHGIPDGFQNFGTHPFMESENRIKELSVFAAEIAIFFYCKIRMEVISGNTGIPDDSFHAKSVL